MRYDRRAKRRQLADVIQRISLSEVAYVPLGQFSYPTALRRNVRDVLKFGALVFWNLRSPIHAVARGLRSAQGPKAV